MRAVLRPPAHFSISLIISSVRRLAINSNRHLFFFYFAFTSFYFIVINIILVDVLHDVTQKNKTAIRYQGVIEHKNYIALNVFHKRVAYHCLSTKMVNY